MSVLWSGKLYKVGVTVDAYAMVGTGANSENDGRAINSRKKDVLQDLDLSGTPKITPK